MRIEVCVSYLSQAERHTKPLPMLFSKLVDVPKVGGLLSGSSGQYIITGREFFYDDPVMFVTLRVELNYQLPVALFKAARPRASATKAVTAKRTGTLTQG
jgi:hypothetical protein